VHACPYVAQRDELWLIGCQFAGTLSEAELKSYLC
jgi:hypothetical protein